MGETTTRWEQTPELADIGRRLFQGADKLHTEATKALRIEEGSSDEPLTIEHIVKGEASLEGSYVEIEIRKSEGKVELTFMIQPPGAVNEWADCTAYLTADGFINPPAGAINESTPELLETSVKLLDIVRHGSRVTTEGADGSSVVLA